MTLLLIMRSYGFMDAFSEFIRSRLGSEAIVICDAKSKAELLFDQINPDIVLVDIRLGIFYDFELIAKLLSKKRSANIIGVTAYYQRDIEESLQQIGAKGYLLRNDEVEIMETIIRKVYAGGTAFGDDYSKAREKYSI